MEHQTRRNFLAMGGATGAALMLSGCGLLSQKSPYSQIDKLNKDLQRWDIQSFFKGIAVERHEQWERLFRLGQSCSRLHARIVVKYGSAGGSESVEFRLEHMFEGIDKGYLSQPLVVSSQGDVITALDFDPYGFTCMPWNIADIGFCETDHLLLLATLDDIASIKSRTIQFEQVAQGQYGQFDDFRGLSKAIVYFSPMCSDELDRPLFINESTAHAGGVFLPIVSAGGSSRIIIYSVPAVGFEDSPLAHELNHYLAHSWVSPDSSFCPVQWIAEGFAMWADPRVQEVCANPLELKKMTTPWIDEAIEKELS
ncbi:MAG: twin-arginine translocation signal domain-containing protein [Propionibacteriaceae bacterium]